MRIVLISFGLTPAPLSATSEDAPQSIRQECRSDSTRMHVCRRPPLPNASPLPRNRTRIPVIAVARCDLRSGPSPVIDVLILHRVISLLCVSSDRSASWNRRGLCLGTAFFRAGARCAGAPNPVWSSSLVDRTVETSPSEATPGKLGPDASLCDIVQRDASPVPPSCAPERRQHLLSPRVHPAVCLAVHSRVATTISSPVCDRICHTCGLASGPRPESEVGDGC